MVSFFGLKLGGDKKKKAVATGENPAQGKKNQQNTRIDNAYFGTTFNKHDLLGDPFSIPRPDTAASLRSARPRAPYLNQAASSSSTMVDLAAGPAPILHSTQLSISSSKNLRHFASDNNLHTRWNDNTLEPLQPPHLTRIPGAPAVERPGSAGPGSTRKPWVNPLDVHFCRDSSGFTPTSSRPSTATGPRPAPLSLTPEPPAPAPVSTSPLSQFNFDLKPLGSTSQQLEEPQPRVPDMDPLVPEPLRPRKPDQASYPAPGDDVKRPPVQPHPPNRSHLDAVAYPSPPLSMDNVRVDQPQMGLAIQSETDARSTSRQTHLPSESDVPTSEPAPQAPASLPSPADSAPQTSEDQEGMGWAVIQDVAAKRDTFTLDAPRRRSLSLDVQKPIKYHDNPGMDTHQWPSSSRNGSPPRRNARRPPPPPLENREFRPYVSQGLPSPTVTPRNREFRAYVPPGSPGHTPAMESRAVRPERSAGSPPISSLSQGPRGHMHGPPATRRPSPALLDGRPAPPRGSSLAPSPSPTPPSLSEANHNMPRRDTSTPDADLRPRQVVDFPESASRDGPGGSAMEANPPPLTHPAPEPHHPNIDPNHPSKGPQDFNMHGRRRPTIGAVGFGERGPGLSPGKRRAPPPRLNTVPPSGPSRPHAAEEQVSTPTHAAPYHFPAWDDRNVFSSPRRAPPPGLTAADNNRATPAASKASPGRPVAPNWPLPPDGSAAAADGADNAGLMGGTGGNSNAGTPGGSGPSSPGLLAGTPFASPGLGGLAGGSGKSHSTAPFQRSQDVYLRERAPTPPYVREAMRRDAGSPVQQSLPPHHGLRAPTGIADEFRVGFI